MARVLFVGLVVLLTGCGASSGSRDVTPPGEPLRSTRDRVVVAAPVEDVEAAVRIANALGLELIRLAVEEGEENVVLSPHGISLALAMAYAGSAGETHTAFEQAMSLTLPEPRLHRANNELDRQLRSRGATAASKRMPFRLDLVNQVFAQEGFTARPEWLDTLAEEYGADVRLLDFAADPEGERGRINRWVEDVTHDLVRELLPAGTIDRLTRFVLVNALSFRAAWAHPFDAAKTEDGPFHLLDGGTSVVPLMRDEMSGSAGVLDGVQIAALPYDGRELSMIVLLPPEGAFEAFEAELTAERLDALLAAPVPAQLDVMMPRLAITTSLRLEDPLSALGLGVAFTEAADFSRLSPEPTQLTAAVHQAVIRVTEQGTEAAAATAVGGGATSVPEVTPVVLDRPFLFLIRDDATGAVLFMGRVVRP